MVFERTDDDDTDEGDELTLLLLLRGERAVDDEWNDVDGVGGPRFSFCNSFKWDLWLIIVESNCCGDNWEVWWPEWFDDIRVVVVDNIDDDERSSSSANSHRLTFANVEQSFWRSINWTNQLNEFSRTKKKPTKK